MRREAIEMLYRQSWIISLWLWFYRPNYSLSFAPESWRRVARAAADFKKHMIRMLDEETAALNEGKFGSGGLMTSFVRALDTKQKEDAKGSGDSSTPKGLTVDEILGNIFVINFAGHDTTANTLAFSMLLLAAHPDVQNWVVEELREFTPTNEKWEYSVLFSKLKRCRAILVKSFCTHPNRSCAHFR
jgi:cytochrome P450